MNQPPTERVADVPDASRLRRYRLIHVVYVVTLLASALSTFGASGLLPGVIICVFWASVFTSRSRPQALLTAGLATLLGLCLLSLTLPAFSRAREASRRMQCTNNLRQIGIALHDYHDTYGSFPPAYVADENGQPKHSWRVLLLPFLEESPLYEAYDFDEPWNGPHNARLLKEMPRTYACPSATEHGAGHPTGTSYVAVVGPTTVWPGPIAGTIGGIKDGTANTVLLIEFGGQQIPWLEPRDLKVDDSLQMLVNGDPVSTGSHQREDFFYRYFSGRHVTFADGGTTFVPHGVGATVWSAMLGKDDGVTWDDNEIDVPPFIVRQLRVGNCLRLALLCGLTLFPLPWVWLNPTSGTTPASNAETEKKT